MTLTKGHLINSLHYRLGLPKRRSAAFVENILESIKSRLEKNEDVLITGFGKFCVKDKKERRGRNPATGEDIILGTRRVIVFRSSGVFKNKVNGGGDK